MMPKPLDKSRLVEALTRWATLVPLVVPWALILAWLASGLTRE